MNRSSRQTKKSAPSIGDAQASPTQIKWLHRGLTQAGGKLPLFDESGRRVSHRTVQPCLDHGWAEPWFINPLMPNWQVCRLTQEGRALVSNVSEKSLNCKCG